MLKEEFMIELCGKECAGGGFVKEEEEKNREK